MSTQQGDLRCLQRAVSSCATPDVLLSFPRQSHSSVLRPNSPTTTSQIMARKKRRGVRVLSFFSHVTICVRAVILPFNNCVNLLCFVFGNRL